MTALGRDHGYTLVELLVSMAIFGIVMALISVSFNRIVSSSGQLIKGVETDIGGLIGLELLRVDLGLAGFGLPWSLGSASYTESATAHQVEGFAKTLAANYNDSHDNPLVNDGKDHPPRAYVLGNNVGPNGSDYLVLKGTALGLSQSSRGWSYLNYSSVGVSIKPAKSDGELVPGRGDRIIVVNAGGRGGELRRDLVVKSSGAAATVTRSFWTTFHDKDLLDPEFFPKNPEDRYLAYGVGDSSDTTISFPFNRVDYFLKRPDSISANCAPGTTVLYKGAVLQSGSFKAFPVLDCVVDMQVIFLLDLEHDGTLVAQDLEEYGKYLKELDRDADLAEAIREHVKEVRIFILAQQGKLDPGYRYAVTNPDSVFVLGDARNGRVWKEPELASTLGPGWLHYRWKVFTIVDEPKNLQ